MNKFNVLDNGLLINKISKTFDKKPIVRDISLNIQKGEIVGLLGPNELNSYSMILIFISTGLSTGFPGFSQNTPKSFSAH